MITSKQRFVLAVLLLVAPFAFAQQSGRITGTVFDDARKPLVGASVAVANTTRGVSTSSDGKFEIVASPNETLVISYLGYATQEIRVDSRTRIDVTLEPQANLIEDLVVVGYGVQKRVNVTGAVSSVNYAKEAESRPVTSTAQLLQGMNAGLMVSQTSGQPGQEGMLMRIRGIGTLNNSAPLVIVDGFESSIANVSPDDIESVSVLKDAASCAIYGNRGANGVVLVTTTTGGGNAGKFNISYNGMVAFNRPANHFELISNYADYMELMNESAENIDGTLPFSQAMIDLWREKEKDPNGIADSGYPNYVAYPNTDWMKAMFENNVYHKHNLSASGSSGGTKYLMSFSYVNNPGVVARTGTERFQLRTNVSSQVTKWLEIGTKLWGYEGTRELNDFGGASDYMSRATPGIYPYYDGKYGWVENPEQGSSSRNNLYFINRFGGEERSHYVNAAVFANVKLPYRIRYNVSFNYARSSSEHRFYGKTCNAFSFSKNDWAYRYEDLSKLKLTQTDRGTYRWTFQNNLSWDYTFAEKHDLTVLAGFEAMYSNTSNFKAQKTGFAQDKLVEFDTATTVTSIDGTQTDFATASFFGRLTYAYDNRYLFETNLRYDGSSRFARKSRWGIFPSVSAGWRISQEAFMRDSGIDNLKLRASWGKLGNHSIDNYEYQATYASGYLYSFGGKQSPGIVASLSNDLLEWETTTSTDVGVELGVLHNRLTFEMDYYNKVTDDILYRAPIFATIGQKSAPNQNLCEVTNNGLELTLGWRDRVKDFSYGISANFTRNWNEVTKYKGRLKAGWVTGEDGTRVYDTNLGDVTTAVGTTRRVMEGKLINEFYLLDTYKGNGSYFFSDGSVNPQGGPRDGMIRTEQDMEWAQAMVAAGNTFLPNQTIGKKGIWYGDYLYADTNGDGIYGNENDYTFQDVSMSPKYYYGFQVDLAWKGIDLSMTWAGAGGFSIYWRYLGFNSYSTRGNTTIPKEIAYDHYFFDPENPADPRTNLTSKHGRLTMNYGSEQNGGTNYSSHWLYKGDYLKLKNLTVGYTLPKKWLRKIRLQDVRIYLSGENLWTITDYPGMDPEFSDTMNYYASLKQYSIGLNIKF